MLLRPARITGRRKLFIKTCNKNPHGILPMRNLREPITSAQQLNRTKSHTKSIRQAIAGFGPGPSLPNGIKTKALGVASGKCT
jgi:hypothetical protein